MGGMKNTTTGETLSHLGDDRTASDTWSAGPDLGSTGLASINYPQVAWKYRYLIVLVAAIGAAMGYMQFLRSPAMFRSTAEVQIVESSTRNLPIDGFEMGLPTTGLADEMLVMRSEKILRKAIELGELSSTPEYSGMQPEQIAGLIAGRSLSISPASDSIGSSVFQISFESTSPTTSRQVVQSIVDAYAMHLKDQYRNVGQETLDLITQARDEVSTKLEKLEGEFRDFKKQSGLIYRGSETTSIHRDNADLYMEQKQQLLVSKAKLTGLLASIQQAIDAEEPYQAILLALNAEETVGNNSFDVKKSLSPTKQWELEKIRNKPVMSAADTMRQQKLIPLEIERETLIETVGKDHPAVETIDKQISILTRSIDKVEASEQALNAELDAAMMAAADEAASNATEEVDPEKRMRDRVQIGVAALRQQMDAINAELELVSSAYADEMRMAREESDSEIRSEEFVRNINRQQQLYDRIVDRLDEVSLVQGGDGLKVFPLNTAKAGYQFAPSLPKCLALGALLGVAIAFGVAILRDMSDRSYHSAREIAEHTGQPIIGHVPVLKAYKIGPDDPGQGLDSRLVTFFNPKGRKSEAFRAIRTAVYFSNKSGGHQVLQVTSATPSDGKSTVAANLAIAMAQSGRSVLLMDGDLRRPRVGKTMGIEQEKGAAWAIGQCGRQKRDAELVIQEAIAETEIPNLSVLPAGERPENPSELLSSSHFDRLLSLLRKKFDMIILDTPPLLAVSDPANIASRVDGVVLVVRLRKNIKPAVAQATRMLETLQANVLGIVVNGVGSRAARGYGKAASSEGEYNYGSSYKHGYGYSYGYTYGYSSSTYSKYYEDDDATSRRAKNKKTSRKAAAVASTNGAVDPEV